MVTQNKRLYYSRYGQGTSLVDDDVNSGLPVGTKNYAYNWVKTKKKKKKRKKRGEKRRDSEGY